MISLPKRVVAFFKDPKSWKVPIAVAVIGALPLCINAIVAGELPDFSLTDLTGTFFASFAAVVFLGSLIVFYVLIAGFAARHIVNSSYPDVSGATPENHNYLIRGNFILGVALLSILVWFGIAAALIDLKLAPHPYTAWVVYALAIVCTALLVFCDWRTNARSFKYSLLACLAASLAFLAVLGLANLIGYAPAISLPTPNVTQVSSTFTTNFGDWLTSAGHWLLGDRLVETAAIFSITAGTSTAVLVKGTRKRRAANRSGQKPEPWIKNEAAKLLLTKAQVIGAFWLFSALTFIFLGLIVEASPASYQLVTALVGGTILLVLNFWAFSASEWKSRVVAGVCTFGFIFGVLPLYGHNITFLPKLVVNVLGLGNRHATDIALASTECPALASYGAECMPAKDTTIGLTNVNVLNRTGSSVIIEIQVQIQALMTPIDTGKSHFPMPASAVSVLPSTRVTYLPAALSNTQMVLRDRRTIANLYPCDEILLEKLRESNPAKADNLACVRFSVPKEDVIGRTIGGAATYAGDFSRFVRITP